MRKERWKSEENSVQTPLDQGPLEEGIYNRYNSEVAMQKLRTGIVSIIERRCLEKINGICQFSNYWSLNSLGSKVHHYHCQKW